MKIYLASNNPGPREGELGKYQRQIVPKRLLSFWQITNKEMNVDTLFEWCKNAYLSCHLA